MSGSSPPVVVVLGSLHYDIIIDAPDRPLKGETVAGHRWWPKFGGKGGNQAVAAARAGAAVRMVGGVGEDEFGRFLLAGLEAGGVDTARIQRIEGAGSGMSVAIIDASRDYGAVIVSGANAAVDATQLDDAELWRDARLLVLQNEMPEQVNLACARVARRAGAKVCLNAAPFRPLGDDLAALVDILIVNAIEAEQISGRRVIDRPSALAAAEELGARFASVIVTAGAAGVAAVSRGEASVSLAAIPVALVSTHGAGDVFVGQFAASLASGEAFAACVDRANRAAALHVAT